MIRFIGLVFATALLNVGLYNVLYVLAPLAAGLACGFFIFSPKLGALGGFLGSVVVYIPFLIVLESIESSGADFLSLIVAAMILSLIGAVGGFIGGIMGAKSRQSVQV